MLISLGGSGANAYKQIIPGGSSGFDAFFGCYRSDVGSSAYFWSSTEFGNDGAWYLYVNSGYQNAYIEGDGYGTYLAFSVRLVKD